MVFGVLSLLGTVAVLSSEVYGCLVRGSKEKMKIQVTATAIMYRLALLAG